MKKKQVLIFGLWHRYHWIAQNLSILISPSTSIEVNHITQNITCAWSKTKVNTYRWRLIASNIASDPTVIASNFTSDFASNKPAIASDVASNKRNYCQQHTALLAILLAIEDVAGDVAGNMEQDRMGHWQFCW